MTEKHLTDSFNQQWITVKLSDIVLKIVGGGTPSKSVSEFFKGPIPFMTVKDLKSRFPATTVDSISEAALESSATSMIEADTIIVATRMALGKIARPSIPVAINQDLKALYFSDDIDKTYFEYWWKSSSQNIESLGTGTTVKGIRLENIYELDFPLPPLAEQVRIAEKLDALLARVEAGRERLERVPKLLKRFRQSVLSAAVSGELTREWRGGGDAEWEATTVGDIVTVRNGRPFPSSDYSSSGVRLIRPGNLHVSGRVVWNSKNTTHMPKKWADENPDYILKDKELLMNLTAQSLKDEFLGRVCIKIDSEPALLNQRICAFYPKGSDDVRPYLWILFKSPVFRRFVDTLDSGTLIKHMHSKQVLAYEMTLPEFEEQLEIVRRVESLFSIADRVEAKYAAALSSFDRLTPALLAKAFRGELVPQDPDDEPASVLLERIRAARADTTKKPRQARAGSAAGAGETGKRGRGRPRKTPVAPQDGLFTDVPEAASIQDAVAQLEARKVQRRVAMLQEVAQQAVRAGRQLAVSEVYRQFRSAFPDDDVSDFYVALRQVSPELMGAVQPDTLWENADAD